MEINEINKMMCGIGFGLDETVCVGKDLLYTRLFFLWFLEAAITVGLVQENRCIFLVSRDGSGM